MAPLIWSIALAAAFFMPSSPGIINTGEVLLANNNDEQVTEVGQSGDREAEMKTLELLLRRHQMRNNVSVVHRLMDNLFSGYHKATSLNLPVVVHIEVLLIKVKGTVEREGIFETVVGIFIKWHDKRLKWDPQSYGNIKTLLLDAEHVISLPDIVMTNSADNLYEITRNSKFLVRVSSDGYLKYVPTGTARTFCDLNLIAFPFDVQTCSLEFESWSLNNKSLTFAQNSVIRFDTSFTSQLWTICKTASTTYNQKYFTGEIFSRVRFDITVGRKSTFFVVNLIFPCTTLSMIQLMVFLLSSIDTTADRIGFGTTNLLTLVVFQTIVTEELPKTSEAVTSLSKYIIALIVTSAVGIFESVMVERMMNIRRSPPPRFIYFLFKHVPFLCREMPMYDRSLERNSNKSSGYMMERSISHESSLNIAHHRHKSTALKTERESPQQQIVVISSTGSAHPPISAATPPKRPTELVLLSQFNKQSSPLANGKSQNRLRKRQNGSENNAKSVSPSSSHRRVKRHKGSDTLALAVGRRRRNAFLWMELAYRIDAAFFIICCMCSLIVPAAIFGPAIYFRSSCQP